jgi:hypothetical protein
LDSGGLEPDCIHQFVGIVNDALIQAIDERLEDVGGRFGRQQEAIANVLLNESNCRPDRPSSPVRTASQ